MTRLRRRFGMFAKYWEPGRVKTRLAKSIGEQAASDVYLAFVKSLLLRFGHTEVPEVVFTPEEREPEFHELVSSCDSQLEWTLHAQGSGDLGDRMHRYFERAFRDGFDRAVLIGTDSPTLPKQYVHQAFCLLDSHEVVLGPTDDGGYYLVAARQRAPVIFGDIAWSTDQVWHQTIGELQRQRIKFAVLPKWYDVDEVVDLQRLRRELDRADSLQSNSLINESPSFEHLRSAIACLGVA